MLGPRAIGVAALGFTAFLAVFVAGAEASDWQLWVPPAGTANNPPPYDQWERLNGEAADEESLDSCLSFSFAKTLIGLSSNDNEAVLRVTSGICFNVATNEIVPVADDSSEQPGGDWQIWLPPPGTAAAPPPYEQWSRYQHDDDWDTLESCQFGAASGGVIAAARRDTDLYDRLVAAICFNAVTREIYLAYVE